MNTIGFLISNGRGAGTSTEVLAKEILAHAINAGYWSSTEYSEGSAWAVYFGNGITWNNSKYYGLAIRAVAAF